ncbi:synaptic plasticity regulator PANTS isoform X1 [Pongo pygmaeus]|uniref:synaptic plasticity regulator PANTS isoform X1 n=1 Tax=Pongo pygmaeus TaxID=9600 RepID=UPI00300CEB33
MADGSGWQPPRPCESYRAEWKLCRSARHFLHHYYVHGEGPACEQWQRDLASCRDWEERRSAEAQVRREGTGRRFGAPCRAQLSPPLHAPGPATQPGTVGVPTLLTLSFF